MSSAPPQTGLADYIGSRPQERAHIAAMANRLASAILSGLQGVDSIVLRVKLLAICFRPVRLISNPTCIICFAGLRVIPGLPLFCFLS